MAQVELNRRELLAAFLGAAAACGKAPETPLPPGQIVGASHDVGHRLREGQPLVPVRWETHDVVIAGGGIAGLAAAWRLHGLRDVLLLELEPVVGGTARAGANYPWGAHYVVAPSAENRVLVKLLREMGVYEGDAIGEQFFPRDPEERLFYRGRWYEGLYLHAGASAEDLRQLRAFENEMARWAAFRDARGRRAFTIPTALCSDDAEATALDRLSMREWMDAHGFTSPRLRWLVEYATRDDYGALMEHTSAWAGVFYFASRDERPVVTWPDGNGRIVAHLQRYAPARTSWLVANITPVDGGVDVIALRGDEVIGIHARRVIFAGPQFVAKHVIPSRDTPRFAYGSWMVANLHVLEHPSSRGFPEAWDNVLYDSPGLGYVVSTHQSGPDRGPTVLTYYYPLCGADVRAQRERLLSIGREGWAEIALADLSRAHPELRSLATRIDVMRWGHAMVRPEPRFIWSDGRRRASEPFRGIHFANTDLSGVALMEE
ncbi:MAG TPA: FAD-dependent oxidoreductase, partial [Thermoanaerobaculia bacterium]|nr:FAD-dependent oxidoreductase [Thermoanaerobaculia bacterium]